MGASSLDGPLAGLDMVLKLGCACIVLVPVLIIVILCLLIFN